MKSGILNKTLDAVINNPSITFTFVIFLILTNILTVFIASTQMKSLYLILSICALALFVSFLSGWFQILRESCDIEKIREKNYALIFFEGVGKNIIPVSLGFCIYLIFMFLFFILFGFIAHKFVGSLDFVFRDMATLPQNEAAIIEYFKNLPMDKQVIISTWQISLFAGCCLFNFLFMYYSCAIVFNDKSNMFLKPFVAMFDCICFVFKHFLKSLGIFVLINSFLLLLSILGTIFVNNEIIRILLLFIYIYFISYAVMLIFNYYEQKYKKEACYNNGCYGEWENKAVDYPGKEN